MFTLCNTSLYIIDEEGTQQNEQLDLAFDVLISISECIMQVCLYLSINKALATFQSESERISQVTRLIESEVNERRFSSETLDEEDEVPKKKTI